MNQSKSKLENLKVRSKVIAAIRLFFEIKNFLEVETPILVKAPLPEKYIDAMKCSERYLVTSPEVYMKRLISNTTPRIFQISKCFRSGETGKLHNEEFSMLEWYQKDTNYFELLEVFQNLLSFVAAKIGFKDNFIYQGQKIDLSSIKKISVDAAFLKFANKKLESKPDDFDFDRLLVEKIEPELGKTNPTALYDYPATFCPMSKQKKDDYNRAERLEIYLCGIELANGCTEKTDYENQVKSLNEEQKRRKEMGKDDYPWPKEFLESFRKIPKCAGMALGIDRLVMLFTNSTDIKEVIAF